MSKIGFLTILYVHVLLISISFLATDFLARYGAFFISLILIFSLSDLKKYVNFSKHRTLNLLLLFMTICTFITSFKVNDIDIYKMVSVTYGSKYENNGVAFGITTAIRILLSFVFVQYVIAKGELRVFFNYLFYVLLVYIVLSDITMLIFGIHESGAGYFLGNKFTVSYLHMFLAVIYRVRQRAVANIVNNRKYTLFLLWTILVSFLVHCSTAFMGTAILVMLDLSDFLRKRILYNESAYIVLITCSILFAFFYPVILSIPFVQYLIVDVLGEDLTLTGRTFIYDAVLNVVEISPLWGFGIDNAYQLLQFLYRFPNAQNGFINLFLEQGLMGTIAVLLVMFYLVKYQIKRKLNNYTSAFLSLLFVLITMAFVEITIDLWFIFLLTLLQITDKDIVYSYRKRIQNENFNNCCNI